MRAGIAILVLGIFLGVGFAQNVIVEPGQDSTQNVVDHPQAVQGGSIEKIPDRAQQLVTTTTTTTFGPSIWVEVFVFTEDWIDPIYGCSVSVRPESMALWDCTGIGADGMLANYQDCLERSNATGIHPGSHTVCVSCPGGLVAYQDFTTDVGETLFVNVGNGACP